MSTIARYSRPMTVRPSRSRDNEADDQDRFPLIRLQLAAATWAPRLRRWRARTIADGLVASSPCRHITGDMRLCSALLAVAVVV